MNSFYEKAGGRIRDLRKKNRYTREEFAELTGISAKFLYEIEKGKKGFSADTLYRITKVLAVSCEYILSGESQKDYSEEMLNTLNLFNHTQKIKVVELLKTVHEINSK